MSPIQEIAAISFPPPMCVKVDDDDDEEDDDGGGVSACCAMPFFSSRIIASRATKNAVSEGASGRKPCRPPLIIDKIMRETPFMFAAHIPVTASPM